MLKNVKQQEFGDMGVENEILKAEVDSKYTGSKGTCLKARYWYNNGQAPGKNGIAVPIEYAWDFINVLVGLANEAYGTNMELVDMGANKEA
jgi:chitodextrinase